MASPFAAFRRNQKVMLATVGLAAIVAFVFLAPLSYMVGGGPKQQNPVVVETKYGNLTRNELENLTYSRDIVDRFVRQLTSRVVANQIEQGFLDSRLRATLEDRLYFSWRQQLTLRSHQDPEQAAIETMILSKRAEALGMVISDQAINDLLKQITADSITPAELQEVIRGLQPTRPISVGRLFEAIRTEMLAAEYWQLFAQSVRDIPPAQRFEYYSRLNRRASAEVMPLAVGDFVDQVADPTKAQLKKFYDRYKNDFPNPDSPEPGFKQPQRATFQYFKADIEQLTERIKPEITEEEISKYYDDNKEQFRAFDFDDEGATTDESEAQEKQGEAESDGEPPADEPKADTEEGTDKSSQSEGEKPAQSEETPESKAEGETPAEAKPVEEKPTEPTADESEENKDESSPQAARASARSAVRLVSRTRADNDPPQDTQPAQESPDDEKAPAEPTGEASQQPDAPTAEEKPTDEKPAEASKEPDESQAAEKTEEPPAEKTPQGEMPAEQPDEPRFEPLEKVADTIRTSLARGRVEERVSEQFDELSAEMRRYTDDLDIYTAEKGIDPKAKPPARLDFAKLAEGKDVQALELKSVTAAEAIETDLGKAFRVVSNPRTQFPFTVPFVAFAFAETLPTYKSEVIQDNENHAFLFWKTAEEPTFVPPLDQIRGKVVLAWKMIKARDLAGKRAEEFAVQARSLKKPLVDLFGSQSKLKITDTGPFSWLTLGNVPAQSGGQPRLSEVEGVDRAGTQFMKAAFALETAGIGIALNEPRTFVYVIRLIEFEPPMEELRDDFARTNPSRYMAAAGEDQRAIYRAWLAGLNKEAGVNWIQQADARRAAEDEAGF